MMGWHGSSFSGRWGGGPAWQWTEKSPDSHVEL